MTDSAPVPESLDEMAPVPASQSPSKYEEKAVLAGLLLGEEDWFQIVQSLDASDFLASSHRLIYSAICEMLKAGQQPDVVSLWGQLENQGEIEKSGGMEMLQELISSVPDSLNTSVYAKLVRNRSTLRKVKKCAAEVAKEATSPQGRSAEEVLIQGQQAFFNLWQERQGGARDAVWLKEAVQQASERLERLSKEGSIGIQSGFEDLDRVILGFGRGDLVILAGRPSTGKTALALQLAQAAIKKGQVVMMFSLEMSRIALAQRLLAMTAKVDSAKLQQGTLRPQQQKRVAAAKQELAKTSLLLDDTPALKMDALAVRARQAVQQHRQAGITISMLVVDYLQLVVGGQPNQQNRVQEVTYVSQNLKALARELEIPVIALSQLNRDPARSTPGSPPRRPSMADLRDSGSIEQDADLILLLNPVKAPVGEEGDPVANSRIEVIVDKHRNGPTGIVNLVFIKNQVRFMTAVPDGQM